MVVVWTMNPECVAKVTELDGVVEVEVEVEVELEAEFVS
jgi:hypothetical protein